MKKTMLKTFVLYAAIVLQPQMATAQVAATPPDALTAEDKREPEQPPGR